MSNNPADLFEATLRKAGGEEAVQRHREEQARKKALVDRVLGTSVADVMARNAEVLRQEIRDHRKPSLAEMEAASRRQQEHTPTIKPVAPDAVDLDAIQDEGR